MQHLIFKKANPSFFVETVNEEGYPQLTENEAMAMLMEEELTEAYINDVLQPNGTEFWGTRPPTRPN